MKKTIEIQVSAEINAPSVNSAEGFAANQMLDGLQAAIQGIQTEQGVLRFVVKSIQMRQDLDEFIQSQPKAPVKGFNQACLDWIRHWGQGGGDQSSETCITDALLEQASDVPSECARTVYDAVAGYSKSDFEALGLMIELITGSLNDCRG